MCKILSYFLIFILLFSIVEAKTSISEWSLDFSNNIILHVISVRQIETSNENEVISEIPLFFPFFIDESTVIVYDTSFLLNYTLEATSQGTLITVFLDPPLFQGNSQIIAVEFDAAEIISDLYLNTLPFDETIKVKMIMSKNQFISSMDDPGSLTLYYEKESISISYPKGFSLETDNQNASVLMFSGVNKDFSFGVKHIPFEETPDIPKPTIKPGDPIICDINKGDTCANNSLCACDPYSYCNPDFAPINNQGCISHKCDDHICAPQAGECAKACNECNISICVEDPLCNTLVGENCENSPQQCVCPEKWECNPNNKDSSKNGCFSPQCGNGICEIEKDECNAGCKDCSVLDCNNDGICSQHIGEYCGNSNDCPCPKDTVCSNENKKCMSIDLIPLYVIPDKIEVFLKEEREKYFSLIIRNTASISRALHLNIEGNVKNSIILPKKEIIVEANEEKELTFQWNVKDFSQSQTIKGNITFSAKDTKYNIPVELTIIESAMKKESKENNNLYYILFLVATILVIVIGQSLLSRSTQMPQQEKVYTQQQYSSGQQRPYTNSYSYSYSQNYYNNRNQPYQR